MSETLKERLDRLSEAATDGEWCKAHSHAAYVRADSGLTINGCGYLAADAEINAAFCMSLVNAYRTGDLIPRDEITPQMAAEVLLGAFDSDLQATPRPINAKMADALSKELEHGNFGSAANASFFAALTAIKESKYD